MLTVELEMQHHPADAVSAMREELLDVHADARAELLDQPFYSVARFWERFENYLRGPNFDLVTGRIGGQLIGYAFGSTLPATSQWWSGLHPDVDDPDLTRETGVRTFAVRELLVRKAFQRRGYGRRLLEELVTARPEERATLAVRTDNPAGQMYRHWGWYRVGLFEPFEDSPWFEAMVCRLSWP